MSHPGGTRPTGESPAASDSSSVDPAPTNGLVSRAIAGLRSHVRTWPRRYVEMRVAARSGRQD